MNKIAKYVSAGNNSNGQQRIKQMPLSSFETEIKTFAQKFDMKISKIEWTGKSHFDTRYGHFITQFKYAYKNTPAVGASKETKQENTGELSVRFENDVIEIWVEI